MRRGFGLLGLVLTVIVLIGIGAVAYNIGWSQGVGTHLPEGATAPPGYYYGYGHPAWGFFGFLWFLLILFGIFWLFRLAFWGFAGRRMMGGGWKGGRGWGHYGGPGSFEERAREWHRKEHDEQPPSGGSPPPPPDTRSV